MSEKDAKNLNPSQWPGMNLLGKVLTNLKIELQDELKNHPVKNQTLNKPIEVMNFYHLNKIIPKDGVYLGRSNSNFNLKGSKFANPFHMKDQSELERNRVVNEYKVWLWSQIAENKITKSDLLFLAGKKLVCYCAPKLCHSHVVKETVELLINNEPEFDKKIQENVLPKKLRI